MLNLMELLCDRLRRNSVAYEDLALTPLSTRLARLLLGMAEGHGKPTPEGIQIRLALSQRSMAAQVAATRKRVNKQLRQCHEAGVLGSQEGYLVLRGPAALRALLGWVGMRTAQFRAAGTWGRGAGDAENSSHGRRPEWSAGACAVFCRAVKLCQAPAAIPFKAAVQPGRAIIGTSE